MASTTALTRGSLHTNGLVGSVAVAGKSFVVVKILDWCCADSVAVCGSQGVNEPFPALSRQIACSPGRSNSLIAMGCVSSKEQQHHDMPIRVRSSTGPKVPSTNGIKHVDSG